MPNQAAFAVENNFRNGLNTEATGLNFPENACTETYNCVFNFDGSVTRRRGFDFEADFETKTIDRTGKAVSSYLWKNVTGVGNLSIAVVQVGSTLYFYEITGTTSTSAGAQSTTVTLTPVAGAASPDAVECQYANGNGVLFVTHPYCEPMVITYDSTTHTATPTNITLMIRDFEGDTADALGITTRPSGNHTSITKAHLYNLYNQGWNLTALNTTSTNLGVQPSNADVVWRYKGSSGYDTNLMSQVILGNTEASKGHYIVPLSQTNRNTQVSVDDGTTITTVTETSVGPYRPATCAFFASRIFYAGINKNKYNTNIYFSQIILKDDQYGKCYQQNDPTAEFSFDLLPDDGGVISIQDAGTIYKLFPVTGGLMVFAQKGVWYITGSTGIGFTANDYVIQPISNIGTLSHTSFVNIMGAPCWWTAEGIYMAKPTSNTSAPEVERITFDKIQTFYDEIDFNSKATARGVYNYIDNVVQWLYKSQATGNTTQDYEFDSILNLNLGTGAFYPWQVPDAAVDLNSIILLDGSSGMVVPNDVVDDSANLVVDDSGDQVIAYTSVNSGVVPQIAYLASYPSSGSYKFTFASARDVGWLDWFSYDDTGQDYDSYFVSGFKLRGQAIRRWHQNWLRIFSRNETDTQFYIRGLWDYATSAATNRWSPQQLITNNTDNYSNLSKRVKIRGHGLALQFRVDSVTGQPFDIIGWAEFSTGNQVP